MEVIFILVPVSMIVVGISVWAFIWSVRNEQFEDLEKEAHSILFEDNELK
jgi:cbb3-type cytochrome oxidase maturation protein